MACHPALRQVHAPPCTGSLTLAVTSASRPVQDPSRSRQIVWCGCNSFEIKSYVRRLQSERKTSERGNLLK